MKSGDVKMAATLFVLMGEETAAEVLRYLNEAEIEAISRQISNVGSIPAEEAEKSAEQLYQLLVANRSISEDVGCRSRQAHHGPPNSQLLQLQCVRGHRSPESDAAFTIHPKRTSPDDRADTRASHPRQFRRAARILAWR